MREIKGRLTHCGTAVLETPRLILRRATLDDCRAIHDNLTTDPDIIEFVGWEDCPNYDDTHKRIAALIEQYKDPSTYHWLVIAKDCNEIAGVIYVVHMLEKRRTAEIDYGTVKHFRGKGYMPEALEKVIKYLFFDVGFYRIEAQCNTDNPASARVMVKAGMQYEGIMRGRAMRMNEAGYPDDIILHGITASDVAGRD